MANEAEGSYPVQEVRLHALTHGVGAALSVAALTVMVVRAGFAADAYRIVSAAVFGASMVLLYSFSTMYHSLKKPALKKTFRVFDHACIYILIAGTYTPFTLVSIRGGWGWSLFGVIWGLAACGIVFKIYLTGRLQILSVAIYLAMGWLGVIAVKPIISAIAVPGLFWLAAGGLMYTAGVAFYAWHRLQYHHAIWHLFVLAGTCCHFVAVYRYVLRLEA